MCVDTPCMCLHLYVQGYLDRQTGSDIELKMMFADVTQIMTRPDGLIVFTLMPVLNRVTLIY